MKKTLSVLFNVLFISYIVLMSIMVFRFRSFSVTYLFLERSINLVPFRTIGEFLTDSKLSAAIVNLLGNIVVFIPYGLYIQVIRKDKRFKTSFLQVLITPVIIEVIQVVFNLGAGDIDDVILNCLGGLIGIAFYRILLKWVKDQERVKTVVTVLSLIIGIPTIAVVGWFLISGGSFHQRP